MKISKLSLVFCFFAFVMLVSCGEKRLIIDDTDYLVYKNDSKVQEDLIVKYCPELLIEDAGKEFNQAGSPALKNGIHFVDTEDSAFYCDKRIFQTEKGKYTNLIYRVHFTRTPGFKLTKGKNVGLIFVVTLDENQNPLLVTSVHTCGCYLGFSPTSFLDKSFYPENFNFSKNHVYGEYLPVLLDYKGKPASDFKIRFVKKSETHRVKDILLVDANKEDEFKSKKIAVKDMHKLDEISFFHESGCKKGYVKGSRKIYETLLMGWWAFDMRVGQDKKLGRNRNDGRPFYTSLKPWAREESDMRDFGSFLNYWGWNF